MSESRDSPFERASTLIERLPLPLAQLIHRAIQGKSAAERHNCAYYLGEASLKLAAAVRIRLYLERALEPQDNVARRLVCLKLPSLGQWCELLRSTNQELGALPDAAHTPLARRARELTRRPEPWNGVTALAEAVSEAGVLNREIARRAITGGPLGFFEMLTAYRNEVIGHGAQRSDEYCESFARLLLGASTDVLGAETLFDGLVLARAVPSADESSLVWQELVGTVSVTTATHADADPTQLYFRADGEAISVHPLVVVRDDELGREQVGFLNRTLLRTRAIADGLMEEVRRVDYLDYASGDTFSAIDTREGMRELLAQSRQANDGGVDLVSKPIVAGAVVGDFEVQATIGRGGTGVVFAAKQRSMGRMVALKMLEPSLVGTGVQQRRFQREIAALARCDHPNVVKVLSAGVDRDRHYYAMEFVDGADLARVGRVLASWRRDGLELTEAHLEAAVRWAQQIQGRVGLDAEPMSAPAAAIAAPAGTGRAIELRIAELFAHAAEGLHHLHERGTVHRDVKPGNLMLTVDGQRIVVMDLGSAHLVDETATMTRSGAGLAGTLRYMAPEQLQGQHAVDGRADVYALGATLYELITGRKMFDGDNEGRIVQQVLGERAPPIRSLVRRAPRSLEAVIEMATAKRAADRYPTARALAEDLRAVASARPTQAKAAGLARRVGAFASRRRGLVFATAVSLGVVTAGGWWTWHFFRPSRSTYRACVEQRGAFTGVDEIDSPAGRSSSCVIVRRAGKAERIEHLNGLGELLPDGDGDAAIDLVYAEGGLLLERVHRRRDGEVRQKHRLAWENDVMHATVVDHANVRASLDGSEVSMYRVSFDDRGFLARRTFFNDRGLPRRNAQQVFGYVYEVDALGRIVAATALDAAGLPSPDRDGVTTERWSFDVTGALSERRHMTAEGRPAADQHGVALLRYTPDEVGNLRTERRYDVWGKPARGEDGCGGFEARYDRSGAVVTWTCLGLDGGTDWHRSGFVERRSSYDDRGNTIEESYFDGEGRPAAHQDGCSSWRATYDGQGHRTEQRFFDGGGAPCVHRDGYSFWRARHDSFGHLIEVSYFGQGGEAVLHRDGVASWTSTYDERGNLLSSSYFDATGSPVLNRYGYARRTWRHDDRGDIGELAFYGTDGQLRASADGYARLTAQYDDRGRRVRQMYFDARGEPTRDTKDLAYGVRVRHDDQGRVIERTMLGAGGEAMASAEGLLREAVAYDGFHRVERRLFEWEDGRAQGEARADWDRAMREASRLGAAQVAGSGERGWGLVVVGPYRPVEEGGPDVRAGDVLIRVEGQPVFDERDIWFEQRRADEAKMEAEVIRDGARVLVSIDRVFLSRSIFGR